MGDVMAEELLAYTIGATYKTTPMGRCGDPYPPSEQVLPAVGITR
ncbi:hypothetical protein C4K04_6314 [Pseudomonas chlororaphis]|uniref:Uncharacterized protein n=1 Tax=Pseudomonas chlororaphis TaxID=587753 RepID=A0A3G7TZS8_9PSED|nr:hypothetical protein C4K04_6314 [Pseudomonas chlororaphis]